jgi:integration host factor subunit beta
MRRIFFHGYATKGHRKQAMNKADVTKLLREEAGLHIRKAEEVVETVFDAMSRSLCAGNRIEIRGFGSFTVREYGGYTGRNPKTGEEKSVKPKRLPFFKAGKDFKERLNGE